jgi:hypothetical protein
MEKMLPIKNLGFRSCFKSNFGNYYLNQSLTNKNLKK